jgi:type VI secretion system protein ImpL
MRTILQALLAIVLLLLLAIISWLFVLYMAWPAWGGFAVFFGVLGVYFGTKAIKRFWVISHTKSKLLATQSAATKIGLSADNFSAVLGRKWKDVTELLKQSQLKRFGNPLYVLPWYMIIGESGAGKTTAITRSRLSSMLRQTAETKQIVQTTNCDWWFFNHAIVLDTAGRYVSPDGTDQDIQEWHYLLSLFTKYRPGEGLNGLVVVVSADALLSGDIELLERQGRSLRERIDHLMRMFEKRFPIYVMVTKADRIYGFTEWVAQLTDAESQEAMGYLHESGEDVRDERGFAAHAIEAISERLRRMRLDMAIRGVPMSPEVLMLPGEVERLREGLQVFLASVFGENPYLEHPYLRGLFLTSGKQEVSLPSRLSAMMASTSVPNKSALTGQKGLFIHDVFARILPKERYVFLSGRIVSRWRTVSRNMALTSWLLVCVAFAVFLLVSYQTTVSTIERIHRQIPSDFTSAMSIGGATVGAQSSDEQDPKEYQKNIDDLSTLLQTVRVLLTERSDWRTTWLAFSPDVRQLEKTLEELFVRKFRLIQQKSTGVNQVGQQLMQGDDPVKKGYAILGAVRYSNMLAARINGANYDQLRAMPQVPSHSRADDFTLNDEIRSGLSELVPAAIAWSDSDDYYLKMSLEKNRALITKVAFDTTQMPWLIQWANSLSNVAPIQASNFWRPDVLQNDRLTIAPGLTKAGSQQIDVYLNQLLAALNNSPEAVSQVDLFRKDYQRKRFAAWREFARGFYDGGNVVGVEPAWRDVVTTLGTKASPFYMFFRKVNDEFAGLPEQDSPEWLTFVRHFHDVQSRAISSAPLKGAANMVSAINTATAGMLRPNINTGGINTGGVSLVGAVQAASKDINSYEVIVKSLQAAAVQAQGGIGTDFKMAQAYFSGAAELATDLSALRALEQNLLQFRKDSTFDKPENEIFWQVIFGPVDILATYVLEQASCQIQQDWERNVISRSQLATSPKEASTQLFGEQGTVWAFVDGPGKNFINRGAGGFSATQFKNYQMPFSSEFMDFLNQAVTTRVSQLVKQQRAAASDKKSAKLSLAAYPLSVNPTAKVRPYAATLVMQCADAVIELSNLNMQANDSFVWSPDQCGETTLEIEVDNMTLTKRYPGPLGLPTLLEEFQDGARVFTPADFPAAADRLDALDITEITIRYDMTGRTELLQLAQDYQYMLEQNTPSTQPALSRMDIAVPTRAGRCWSGTREPEAPLTVPKFIKAEAEKKVNPPPPPPVRKLPPIEPLKPAPTKSITIVKGDTLFSIGRKYKVDPGILRALNGLKSDTIIEGSKLLVPIWATPAGLKE